MSQEMLSCGALIKRLDDIMEKNANCHLQKMGITFSQIKLLIILSEREDKSATLKELERHFNVSQATIAGITARLEKKGLVYGYGDSKDKRVKHIRLSEEGERICSDAEANMDKHEKWLISSLNDAEVDILRSLLQRIYDDKCAECRKAE